CSFLYFSRLLTVLFVGERIYPLILNINANLALDPSGSQKGVNTGNSMNLAWQERMDGQCVGRQTA
ncbi:MAG: hypothetical protein WBJ52_07395, partial [Methanoregulaceae archaeon]